METPSHTLDDLSSIRSAGPNEPPDIADLTGRMAAGEEHAYRQFYHAYIDRLSRYLLVVTAGNEDAMREAIQRTLMRIVKNIRVFSREEIFWSWLTVLARSSVIDESRQRRRYLAFLDRFAKHKEVEGSVLSREADTDRLGELLKQGLAVLPDDERTLLEKKYFEHQSVRDIADLQQVSEKTIESKLVRIRAKLKKAVLAALQHEPHP